MKYIVTLNGKQYEVDVEQGQATTTYLGKAEEPALRQVVSEHQGGQAGTAVQELPSSAAVSSGSATGVTGADGEVVTAPMPGIILDIQCAEGQKVIAGQVLFVLEAMKMENELIAPKDGVVKQLLIRKNEQVETGAVLCMLT